MANVGIPNPTWLGLLTRLGIQRFGAFFLGEVVVPVAIVDAASVTITAVSRAPLFGTPASAGVTVAPGANTRLADTGQLAAGNWSLKMLVSHNEAAGTLFRIARRNAADAADVWSYRFSVAALANQDGLAHFDGRFSVVLNERIVVENLNAGAGAYQASIFAVQD